MIRKRSDMTCRDFYDCHDGSGLTRAHLVLQAADSAAGIQLMHDDIIAPGASIGEHPHHNEEEIYFIAAGQGIFISDGQEQPAAAGDVLLCKSGHSHGIINNSDQDLRLLVIAVTAAQQ